MAPPLVQCGVVWCISPAKQLPWLNAAVNEPFSEKATYFQLVKLGWSHNINL